MKKIFAGILSAIMVLSAGTAAFAAETVIEQNGREEIAVRAQAVYINPDGVYDSSVKNGEASITTANGAVIGIAANNTALDGLTLNVIEMIKDDKEAYSWISGVMSGLCDNFTAYDIYLTDKDGNRVDVTDSVTVSITTPDGYTNVQVCRIGSSAKPNEIAYEQIGKNTRFTANEFGYYVLCDKTADGVVTTDPAKPGNPDNPDNPDKSDNSTDQNIPQTGDTGNMALWTVLLLASGGAAALGFTGKKRKKNVEN